MSGEDKDVMPIEVPTDEELFMSDGADETTHNKAEEAKADDAEGENPDAKAEAKSGEEGDGDKPDAKSDEEDGVPAKDKEGEVDHRVPLTELLNEREKRQDLQRQYKEMEQVVQQWQQWHQAQQQQAQAPDMFEDPEYYQQYIHNLPGMLQKARDEMQQQYSQQLALQRMEFMGELSLERARARDPEKYDKAWAALEERFNQGDQSWRQQILNSQDPGAVLLDLYDREQTVNTAGSDPEAYRQKVLDELKSNPQLLAELLGGNDPSSQTPKVELPPSLNRAGGGSAGQPLTISGKDLWDDINS